MKIDNEELQAVSAVVVSTTAEAAPRYAAIEGEHKVIPKERLKAIPYARLCVNCKKKEEGV